MIKAIPRFDSWEPQLLQCLLDTASWVYLYALQETSGATAKDYSGNGRDGTNIQITLNQPAPNRRINKMAKFTAARSSKIAIPKTGSVRNLAAVTLVAVTNLAHHTAIQGFMAESTADIFNGARLAFAFLTDNTLKVYAKTELGDGAPSTTIVTNAAVPLGPCIIHVTIDIPNDQVVIYRNGVVLASTPTISWGAATAWVDTEPFSVPVIGSFPNGAESFNNSTLAYVGIANTELSAATILLHAKAAGFA